MTDTARLCGLGTALITPFQPNSQVDYKALEQLIDLQLEHHTDYLVVLGTTAEAATLTPEEKEQVMQTIIRCVNCRIPLVLGIGGNNTAAVLQDIKRLKNTLQDHFAAILSVCPYYNKPSQEGLYQHFTLIAEASPIPVILYNVPGRTGVNLLPETVQRLYQGQRGKIIGIKEASGNIEQIEQVIHRVGQHDDFLVISGDDGITATLMDKGAKGLISVAANAFPADFRRIVHEHDHTMQARYAHIVSLLFKEGNPAGIKTVLYERGLIFNRLRLPLVSNSPTVQHEIHEALQEV